jgi:hypothetical protein
MARPAVDHGLHIGIGKAKPMPMPSALSMSLGSVCPASLLMGEIGNFPAMPPMFLGGMRQVGVTSGPCSSSIPILLSPWAEPS